MKTLTHVYNIILFLFVLTTEQDQGLEALSGIIQRQKFMGQAISDEVDAHNGQFSFELSDYNETFLLRANSDNKIICSDLFTHKTWMGCDEFIIVSVCPSVLYENLQFNLFLLEGGNQRSQRKTLRARTMMGHISGKWAFSPLRHLCSP